MTNKNIISHWMKRNVISIQASATIFEAIRILLNKKVGTLPILDNTEKLIGEVSITDIVQIFLPDFVSLMENIDFVLDYGALKTPDPSEIEKIKNIPVTKIMKPPIYVEHDCSLIRALSVMKKHNLRDLLVVRKGQLVGLASWVDVGRAFLHTRLSID